MESVSRRLWCRRFRVRFSSDSSFSALLSFEAKLIERVRVGQSGTLQYSLTVISLSVLPTVSFASSLDRRSELRALKILRCVLTPFLSLYPY
jgi:hypothetical protein